MLAVSNVFGVYVSKCDSKCVAKRKCSVNKKKNNDHRFLKRPWFMKKLLAWKYPNSHPFEFAHIPRKSVESLVAKLYKMGTRTTVYRYWMNFVYDRKTTLGTKCVQRLEHNLYNSYRRIIWQFCHGLALFLSFYRFVYKIYTATKQSLKYNPKTTLGTEFIQLVNTLYTTFIQFEPEFKVHQIYGRHVRFADML